MLKAEPEAVGVLHRYLPQAMGSGGRLIDVRPALRVDLAIGGVGILAREIQDEIVAPGGAVLLERAIVVELVLGVEHEVHGAVPEQRPMRDGPGRRRRSTSKPMTSR